MITDQPVPESDVFNLLIFGKFTLLDNQGAWEESDNFCQYILDFDPCLFHLTDQIFYQSAALPPLAAPAQTWKPRTANMNTLLAIIAAAASAQIHLGSALIVSLTQQLEPDFGS